MSVSLKNACFQIWNPMYERKGIQTEFRPLFVRYIGVEIQDEYNDILKTLATKLEENPERSLCFDGEIPLGDAKIVSYFSEQLRSVDISHLTLADVTLFDGQPEWSSRYLDALNEALALATEKEHFFNENIKRNFVKKQKSGTGKRPGRCRMGCGRKRNGL